MVSASPETGEATSAKLSKLEQAKAEFCGLDLASRLGELGAAGWESLDEADLTIRLKWLGIFFRPVTPGRFMVRLRLPNGVITAQQLELLADAVDRCGEEGSASLVMDTAREGSFSATVHSASQGVHYVDNVGAGAAS